MEKLITEGKSLLQTQPNLARTVTIGLCGVLLVLFVLRPAAREMTASLREPLALPASASVAELPRVAGMDQMGIASEPTEQLLPIHSRTRSQLHQGIFEQVSEHIRREPVQSTRLIEAWIGTTPEVV